jgi:hypothetical protein
MYYSVPFMVLASVFRVSGFHMLKARILQHGLEQALQPQLAQFRLPHQVFHLEIGKAHRRPQVRLTVEEEPHTRDIRVVLLKLPGEFAGFVTVGGRAVKLSHFQSPLSTADGKNPAHAGRDRASIVDVECGNNGSQQ